MSCTRASSLQHSPLWSEHCGAALRAPCTLSPTTPIKLHHSPQCPHSLHSLMSSQPWRCQLWRFGQLRDNCPQTTHVTPRAEPVAGGKQRSPMFRGSASLRMDAQGERHYLSSVNSLIYRETPGGKAISLKAAVLGMGKDPVGGVSWCTAHGTQHRAQGTRHWVLHVMQLHSKSRPCVPLPMTALCTPIFL